MQGWHLPEELAPFWDMAWRIDEYVVRGEIENCTRGRVTGRIWFAGRDQPVELELTGNAWRDLAGHRLEFVNPEPKPGLDDSFAARQEGLVGDITASRKVKVLEVPKEKFEEYYLARIPMPWHWGNSLYLEWFGTRNGRVVIESADYQLSIVGVPEWGMTAEEEIEQRQANAKAMEGFFARLNEAFAKRHGRTIDVAKEEPMTEEEAERLHERNEELATRIAARVAGTEGVPDLKKIIREEIDRMRRERGEPDPTPEQLARSAEWMGEMNRACEEAEADGVVEEWDEEEHPLAARARELTLRLIRETKARKWMNEKEGPEHPVADLVFSVMKAGVKLAGALNDDDWPPDRDMCADAIVRMKRALVHLESAKTAAEECAKRNLTEPAWIGEVSRELATEIEEASALLKELRERLERGFD